MSSEPTHARRSLLSLLFALTVITYLDRLCISAAMPSIAAEFALTPDQKGWVFSAFTLAYAAFEIPSGWLGDRFGARCGVRHGGAGSATFLKNIRRSTTPN